MRWFFRQTSPLVVLATLMVTLYSYVTQWSVIAGVGGFTIHVTDLLVGLTVIYCIAGALLAKWRYSSLEFTLLILCGLLVLSFGRGIAESRAAAAGVEFREFAGFVSLVWFIFVWGRQLNVDWIFDKIVVLGWGIVLLSLTRLILGWDVGLDASFVEACELTPAFEFRVISGAAGLMLGQASLIALNKAFSVPRGAKRWRTGATFFVFATTLLISQQRTAIFATLSGLGVIIAFSPRHYRTIMIGAGSVALLCSAVTLWVAWIAAGGDIIEYLPRAISMVVLQEGTFGWRVEQWESYFDMYLHAPLIDQIIGQPFGVRRLVAAASDDPLVRVRLMLAAHNEYMQLLLNVGAAGLLLFASMLICVLVRGLTILKTATCFGPASKLRLAVAIAASHAVYSVGYSLPNEQGLLLATALQIVATLQGSPTTLLEGRGRRNGRLRVRYQG